MNERFPKGTKRIAPALRWFRNRLGETQKEFAKNLGIGEQRWASYEDDRAPLRWHIFRVISDRYGMNPRWLAVGDTHLFAAFDESLLALPIPPRTLFLSAFRDHLADRIQAGAADTPVSVHAFKHACETISNLLAVMDGEPGDVRAKIAASPWFSKAMLRLFAQAKFALDETEPFQVAPGAGNASDFPNRTDGGGTGENELLTNPVLRDYSPNMAKQIPDWETLRKKIGALASSAAVRVALMKQFHVSKQTVSGWITGDRKPTAETTLLLLRWATEQETK